MLQSLEFGSMPRFPANKTSVLLTRNIVYVKHLNTNERFSHVTILFLGKKMSVFGVQIHMKKLHGRRFFYIFCPAWPARRLINILVLNAIVLAAFLRGAGLLFRRRPEILDNKQIDVAKGIDLGYLFTCNGLCNPSQRCFLGKCHCLSGRSNGPTCRDRKPPPGNLIDPQHCPDDLGNTPDAISASPFVTYPETGHCNITVKSPENCAIFCYWQEDAGIVHIPRQAWEHVSNVEFSIWESLQRDTPEDRDGEHAEGFGEFKTLPTNLGNYLEVGSGPYTQTKNIIKTRARSQDGMGPVSMNTIYLAEPNIFRYLRLDNCAYKDGRIEGRPVNLLSLPVEDLPATEFFDTIVSINVLEHVNDAMRYLTAVYMALKPGGILVFCDRYFDHPDKDTNVLGPAVMHPIRMQRRFLQHFLRLFDTNYLHDHNTTFARRRDLNEKGYYFIGRKKSTFSKAQEPLNDELDVIFPSHPFPPIIQRGDV